MNNTHEFPYIPYNLKIGPLKRSITTILSEELPIKENDPGMNCRLYTSLVVRALGFAVPDHYSSSEWFHDPDGVLSSINYPTEDICDGDILGFSRPNEIDMINLHVGVARITRDGTVEILHASRLAGKVIVTPLDEMHLDPRHKQLYMVRRPQIKTVPINFSALTSLGWFAHV